MSKRAAPPATPPVTPSATLPEGAEAATPRRARGRPAWAPYGEPTRAMRIPESLVPAVVTVLEARRQAAKMPAPTAASARLGGNLSETLALAASPSALALRYVVSPSPQAGFPSPAADYVEDALDLNRLMVRNPPATFCVRVRGPSMEDARIFDGDILIVDRSLQASPGRIVVAAYDGDLYVKRLKSLRGRPALVSENAGRAAEFPPMYLDQAQDCTLWGVVTDLARTF